MKKIIVRPVAIILAAMFLVMAVAGCNKNGDDPDNPAESSELVFVPEFISLPDGIRDISNLVVSGDMVFFSSWFYSEDDPSSNKLKLYSMDIDGTNLKDLHNYNPGEPPEGAMASIHINTMRTDIGGNLWVVESGSIYTFDVPEDEAEDVDAEYGQYDMWQYYRELVNIMAVRKLDDTGAELMSVDVSSLVTGGEMFWINSFCLDGDDNIYIGIERAIYVLNNEGRLQFKLEVQNWVDQLIRMPDGSISFFGWTDSGMVLRKIDFAARAWGEDIGLPMNAYNVMPGSEEYSIIYNDGTNLFGMESDTGEVVKLLNWIDSDISTDGLGNQTMLSDGRILCTNNKWDRVTGMSNFELIILSRVPQSSLPQRTIITFATVWMDWNLRNAVVDFNRNNDMYRIQVTDYSEFNREDDWSAGLTRLSTEIISGKVPDILDVSNLPYKQYVARGILADLYPFIDADKQLSRGDLMENVFRAAETNGRLYQIFPTFNITTIIGHPSVLGEEMGWNMNEFRALLKANPKADLPLGQGFTKGVLLNYIISMGMDEYVDWTKGMCYFDSDGFIQLLEFANTFPDEYNWEREEWLGIEHLIPTGRQIMMITGIDLNSIQFYKAMFGGEIVFKGFPAESRKGNSLSVSGGIALTNSSSNKEGAWEFIRTVLTEDWQRANVWGFPTNRNIFNEKLKEVMTPQYYIDDDGNEVEYSTSSWGWDGITIEIFAMKQEEADQIMELLDSVTGISSQDERLMTIITEGVTDFFAGRRSAQDAARIIQSRASIFISEQS